MGTRSADETIREAWAVVFLCSPKEFPETLRIAAETNPCISVVSIDLEIASLIFSILSLFKLVFRDLSSKFFNFSLTIRMSILSKPISEDISEISYWLVSVFAYSKVTVLLNLFKSRIDVVIAFGSGSSKITFTLSF